MKRLAPLLIFVLILAPLVLTGCGNQTGANGDHAYRNAPLSQMPHEVKKAPATVRQAYQFAVYNPEVVEALPCYCGCGAMGHTSNYSCYVEGSDENGELIYDTHALGCQICVDITQDAMRMLDEGRSMEELAEYVDATYSAFGPPTVAE